MIAPWSWIAENFNNREISGAIWIAAFLLFFSLKKDVRKSMMGMLGAIFAYKLLILFIGLAICVALLAWLSALLTMWDFSLLAPTVVWYFFGGLPLLSRSFDAKEGSQHFLGYAKDALSGTVFLEFIFVAGTFSLPVELILTPVITVLALMAVVSERQPEHAKVNSLMTWLSAVVALVVLWNSVSQIVADPDMFFTTDTFKSFILPIYLTIGSIPFFYGMHCVSQMENANVQIGFKAFQSDDLKAYARRRFFLAFALRPWLLRRATRQFHCLPAKELTDVDAIIRDICKYEKEARNPPDVDPSKGWSPYKARDLLADEELRTADYHQGFDGGEWFACSSPIDLDDQILPNTATFYTEGIEGLVTELKLKGHFQHDFSPQDAVSKFLEISQTLLEKAAPDLRDDVAAHLIKGDEFVQTVGTLRISLEKDAYPSGKDFSLIFRLSKGNAT